MYLTVDRTTELRCQILVNFKKNMKIIFNNVYYVKVRQRSVNCQSQQLTEEDKDLTTWNLCSVVM